jgi:UDP-N-acetylmuramate--alanine ligase
MIGYGVGPEADLRAINVRRDGFQTHFDVVRRGEATRLAVTVNLPGTHNVLNSLAAIAVALELGIGPSAIRRALAQFQGVDRRLTRVADLTIAPGTAPITLVDDYGHHPTEIAATLDALRQGFAGRRIVLAFQPHRYTRTRDLLDDFARVLSSADVLLVTEVYSAGEAPIAGADGRAICRAVRSRGHVEPVFVERIDALAEALNGLVKPGDVIVTQGAGNVSSVSHALPGRLEALGVARRVA